MAVRAQAEAARVPVDQLSIPMDEAAGPGPETVTALDRLRGADSAIPGLVGFGEAINERIAGLRARATTNAARAAADLNAEAGAQRAGVRGAVLASRQAVGGVVGATRARTAASLSTSRESVRQAGQAGKEQTSQAREEETARLTQTVEGGTEEARSVFSGADEELRVRGEAEAQRGRDHAHDLARRALALGRDEAARYRQTEEDADLGERKAEAVSEVAGDFAGQLRSDGDQLARDVRDQAQQAREQVREEAEPGIEGVATSGDGARDGIGTLFGSVDDGVDAVMRQGSEQLEAAQAGVTGEIDNVDQAAQGRGEALLAEGEARLDLALAAGQVSQAKVAGQASQLVDEAGRDAIDQLAGAATDTAAATGGVGGAGPSLQRQPDTSGAGAVDVAGPGELPPQVRDDALAPLDQMGPALDQATGSHATEMRQSLQGAGGAAAKAGSDWENETKGNMDRLGATAEAGLQEVVVAAGGQVDATVTEGRVQAAGEVDRVSSEIDTSVGKIRESVTTNVDQATDALTGGTREGVEHADQTAAQLPGTMRQAAEAQEGGWLSRLGGWVADQLSDVVSAVKGMWDWKFVLSLAVGIVVGIAVGVGVALLIAAAPFTLPGLAVALIVGAAAGAAGFAAAQITGNLLDPDPNRRWYEGVGHAALLGAFVGGAAMAAPVLGLGLLGGTLLVMAGAGVGTVVANLATGRAWDDHLLANIFIVGIFHALIKTVSDRIPSRRTGPTPKSEEFEPFPKPSGPEITIDSPARIRATDFVPDGEGGLTCNLVDATSGAKFGTADIRLAPDGKPLGGPELTLHPRNSTLPDGSPAILKAPKGFAWTDVSLQRAMEAYVKKFGTGPLNMGGQLAWANLANFQAEFARIRVAEPGLNEGVVAERAVKAISFGKHRISMGYGDISVKYGNMGDVTVTERGGGTTVLKNVPRYVEVEARPTTPGVIPVAPEGGGATHEDDEL